MFPSEKFHVPSGIALLYDFVNSLDQRRYVEHGRPHTPRDALATASDLQAWMRDRGLLKRKARLDARDHRRAVALRQALRSFLQLAPADRAAASAQVNAAAARFPMILEVAEGTVALHPASATPIGSLGYVLAEFQRLAETGELERMKMCAPDECGWIFYDRSKPGNRRWCSSTICGNREKTRSYRSRWKQGRAGGR
jgi:predicted RNA-binding Zn ribbon-like protein